MSGQACLCRRWPFLFGLLARRRVCGLHAACTLREAGFGSWHQLMRGDRSGGDYRDQALPLGAGCRLCALSLPLTPQPRAWSLPQVHESANYTITDGKITFGSQARALSARSLPACLRGLEELLLPSVEASFRFCC